MLLTEKLKNVAADVKRIRESLTTVKTLGEANLREAGEIVIRQRNNGEWEARVRECAKLIRDVLKGDQPSYLLQEAMTTTDFPILFGDTLNRQLLGNYAVAPVSYPGYFDIHDVKDFRTMKMVKVDGGGGPPLAPVAERAPYPETSFVDSQSTLTVAKYGRRYGISFEMIINDDLNAFQSRPQIMATDARLSEEYLATTKVFDTNGPNASFFSAANGNIVTSNPALAIAGLQTAMTILGNMKDSSNRPITITEMALVVPPALEITARNILNATEIRVGTGGGSASSPDQLIVPNWMSSRVKMYVNSFIPIIVGATNQNRCWVLVANSPGSGRSAFHFGFLRGYRQPQLSMKQPNNVSLSGPTLGAQDGDFDTDAIDYRVRHIFGAATDDVKLAVGSNGSGS